MALPSTPPISLTQIQDELGLERGTSLTACLAASNLADKSLPVPITRFLGYSHSVDSPPDALDSSSVSIVAGCSGGLEVSWEFSGTGSAPSYVSVEVSIDGGAYTHLADVDYPLTSYQVGVITAGSDYQFRLTPVNSAGSGPSSVSSVSTAPGKPNPITNASVSNDYPSGITISINHSGTGPTVYAYWTLLFDETTGSGVEVIYIQPGDLPYLWTSNLTEGHTYHFEIGACGSAGVSATVDSPSIVFEEPPLEAPGAPKTFNTVQYRAPNGSNGAELGWQEPTSGGHVENYRVEYRYKTPDDINWNAWSLAKNIGTSSETLPPENGTTLSHAFFTAYPSGTEMEFRVRSENSAGVSSYTQWSGGQFVYY